mgnify:CR=1 FL=1
MRPGRGRAAAAEDLHAAIWAVLRTYPARGMQLVGVTGSQAVLGAGVLLGDTCEIAVLDQAGNDVAILRTDDDGRFTAYDLSPGDYRARVVPSVPRDDEDPSRPRTGDVRTRIRPNTAAELRLPPAQFLAQRLAAALPTDTLAAIQMARRPLVKDFLLSRMLEVRGTAEAATSAAGDDDWHSEITLEVGPHPGLSETQAKVIALDYGMRGGKAEIKVRRALLYYALRRLGLDTDPAARKPQDQQIVLLNRDVILGRQGQAEEQ